MPHIPIRDISNHSVVNLLNCESEPIHIPGSIQPYGFLIGISAVTYSITYCSANCAEYLHMQPAEILGRPLDSIVGAENIEKFREYVKNAGAQPAAPFVFTLQSISYNTSVHQSNDTLVLEFEPYPGNSPVLPDLYMQTRRFVSVMENVSDLQHLCQHVAEETRAITGYDRVMIYRFDKNYNGEVYAEACREDLQPFLGLNYPHTDIPVQARQLYMLNLLRMIADINYTPVPIYTQGTEENKTLDLSLSLLRSVSPMHVEYLQNMGVGATLTISLILNKKLWGLIACHHYSPKSIPYYTRLAAQLQGHFLTSQISVREVAEEYEIGKKIEAHLQHVLNKLALPGSFTDKLDNLPNPAKISNATGVAMRIDGRIYKNGLVPPDDKLETLLTWLENQKSDTFITSHLAAHFAPAEEMSEAAGILYYPLGVALRKNCIVWFRQEIEKTINWAGNPDKAVVVDAQNEKLSPRKSFALWKQSVRYHSREWRDSEINAASRFASALQNTLNTEFLEREEIKYRTQSEKLKKANDELSNINWIATHDLKEPLRKILLFISRIHDFDKELPDRVQEALERISSSTVRMQTLIDDLLVYSLLNTKNPFFVSTGLDEILQQSIAEHRDEIEEKNIHITTEKLPQATVIPSQMGLLFSNLIGNAIKFHMPGQRQNIAVRYNTVNGNDIVHPEVTPGQQYHEISFTDSGIGFEEKFSARLFDIFYRLHPQGNYAGTGIGLAICKRIMQNHHGFITAKGTPHQGAIFSVYLPV